ncbi:hypothetical protein A4X03_0g6779, partial [Tilletia caries]
MTASTSFVQESDRSALDMVVRVANGKSVPVVRAGNVEAILRGQAQSCAVPLSHVLVVPELDANLLSTHQLARQGFVTVITGLCTLLVAPSGRVLVAHVDKATGAAYFMVRPRHRDPSSAQALVASVTADGAEEVSTSAGLDWRVELWHRRYGHIGLLKLIDLAKAGLLSGKDAPTVGSIKRYLKDRPVCDVCAIANLRAAPYPSHSTSQTRSRLELVHSDLIGPFLGHPSFAWVLTLVDDFTRKTWIYCLPNRTAETLRVTLDAWAEQVEAATSQQLVTLHTDNGKEFVAKELQDWAKARGTAWIWTAPYSSSQNGVAERRNGLLEERMRAMLRAARLPLGFWPYAVQYAASAAAVLGMAIVWAGLASAQGTTADGLPLEPQNLKQAQARPPAEWTKWQEAMHEEIGSLREMGTWELVEAPPNRNIVGSRWVFKLKTDRDGFAARYKARLVAQGFTQREGIDFSDTFAPVARLATIRLVISIALALDLSLGSIDIKTAYLNGKLYDEVYMQQPPEYDDGTGRVCLLRRAIYGVKQAGRAWFDTLKARLLLAGYEQVGSEPCLFVRFGAGGSVILAVYVDDIVIAARGQEGVAKVKAEFASWYKITDNGGLSHILGMRVDHDPRTRTAKLGQTAYIDFLVRKYKMESETALPTPMTDASRQLGPNLSGQASKSEVHDFAALIGCLLWLAQGTRPDIAFPVGYLARFMSNPSPAHFLAAKRILRYLKGTRTKGLHFTGTEKAAISGWSDSDHATDHSTRRSVSAYIFRVFGNMVTWRSKLQATVSVSSTEAEYIALSEASREAKWLRSVLTELGIKLRRATDILTDNKGAEAISKDPGQHGKTKHIEVHHHLVRKLQEMKEVLVGRVHTDSNPADMLTKVMTREKLSRLGRMVGFGDLGSAEEGVQVGEGSSAEKEK